MINFLKYSELPPILETPCIKKVTLLFLINNRNLNQSNNLTIN